MNKTKKSSKLKEWWMNVQSIFYINLIFSTNTINFTFCILNLNLFTIMIQIPNFYDCRFYSFWNKTTILGKNKVYDHQLYFVSSLNTGFTLGYHIHQHHGGFRGFFSLLGFVYACELVDERHWNSKKHCYIDINE